MTEPRWVDDLLPQFLEFCTKIRIFSKEEGVVPLRLLSSQVYVITELFQGLDDGIHNVVIVKARQLGISTLLWALDLWWLQKFSGIQGMYVVDDDANKEIHRNTIGAMYLALPKSMTRGPFKIHNRHETTWHDHVRDGKLVWAASRMMWAHASPRDEGQLGRSRGINFLHGDEVDGWKDRKGVDALTASLADTHPYRLYLWVGTGQGYGLLYEMWEQAGEAVTKGQIFCGWWRLDKLRVTRDEKAKWAVYGTPRPSPDEAEWTREVEQRYGVVVTHEQLTWWRFKLAEGEGINGDEATMLAEYPWLPEQAFQAAGSQFLSAGTMLRMHHAFDRAPEPTGYRYDWGATFDAKGDDALVDVPIEQATLTIWEQPAPSALYVVAGDPAYGSSEKADRFAVTVWRCHPDKMIQVAEYCTPVGTMYQYAWTLAHLASNYPRWLIYDINGPGAAVMQELKRLAELGFGLTKPHGGIQDVIGGIQHYLWTRPDSLSPAYSIGWKSGTYQEQIMEQLRDTCERGALVVRSRELWHEIGSLRRNEGKIEAGGIAHDDLAVTAAMAVEYWLTSVIHEIEQFMAPADATPTAKTDPVERAIRSFMRRMNQGDEEREKRTYGVRAPAPGR